MKCLDQPRTLEELVLRLRGLQPATERRWGTMSPGEMLCHVGDASASILKGPGDPPKPRRTLMKFVALYTPVRWPQNVKTPGRVDPRRLGSRPGDFERDRDRAIDGLRALSGALASALPSFHGHFGPMSRRDWQRWAYKHTDHHLRQFGL
jgi:DinB family protein